MPLGDRKLVGHPGIIVVVVEPITVFIVLIVGPLDFVELQTCATVHPTQVSKR